MQTARILRESSFIRKQHCKSISSVKNIDQRLLTCYSIERNADVVLLALETPSCGRFHHAFADSTLRTADIVKLSGFTMIVKWFGDTHHTT